MSNRREIDAKLLAHKVVFELRRIVIFHTKNELLAGDFEDAFMGTFNSSENHEWLFNAVRINGIEGVALNLAEHYVDDHEQQEREKKLAS